MYFFLLIERVFEKKYDQEIREGNCKKLVKNWKIYKLGKES